MGYIDWEEHREEVLRICAEEIASGGMRGYKDRSLSRVRDNLGFPATKKKLSNFLEREGDEWRTLREDAKQVYSGEAPSEASDLSVHVEAPPEPLPADHPMVRDLERKIQALQSDLRHERKRRKEADEQAVIGEAIRGQIQDSVAPWEPDPYSPPDQSGEWPCDMVVVLSDEHADHVVRPDQTMGIERYNFDVFRTRAQRLVETVEGFARHHLPNYDFDTLHVLKLGDAIHGDIHDMKHRNDLGNSIRAAMATGDVEAEMVQRWARSFEHVNVICVPGNHPRQKSKKDPEDPHDNLDFAVACTIAQRTRRLQDEGRVSVHAPRSWGAFLDVRGWKCRMSHGDEVRSYRGFPWYGFDRREGRVKAMTERAHAVDPDNVPDSLDYLFYGHFHTPTKRSHAASRSIHNGAFYETDAYTTKELSVGTIPEQTVLVFGDREPDMGHFFEIPVYLRDREREERLHRGLWEPDLGRETILEDVA